MTIYVTRLTSQQPTEIFMPAKILHIFQSSILMYRSIYTSYQYGAQFHNLKYKIYYFLC